MERTVRWILLSLLVALVASCGQSGPLYLPEEPQAASVSGQFLPAQPDAHNRY